MNLDNTEKFHKNWLKPENYIIASLLEDTLEFWHLGHNDQLGYAEEFEDIPPIENSEIKISPDIDNRCLAVCIEEDVFVYSIIPQYECDNDDEDSLDSDELETLIKKELNDICEAATQIVSKTLYEHQQKNPPQFLQLCLPIIAS